jgi:hypothetical protein
MLDDLTFIIACLSLTMSVIILLAYQRTVLENRKALNKLHSRLHYIEMAASYRNITPLPWEREEYHKVNNVIYLEEKE